MKTSINKSFKSKVFKAAWTSIRNGKSANLSEALKSAWAWAKKTLNQVWNLWSPKPDFMRFYAGDGYVQISLKERSPKGYYECHRYAKGERGFYTAWYKLVGISSEYFSANFSEISGMIHGHVDFVESKF